MEDILRKQGTLTREAFDAAVVVAMDAISIDDCQVWLKHAGYTVEVRWLATESMWNWVETSPADASAEEVSLALFGTTSQHTGNSRAAIAAMVAFELGPNVDSKYRVYQRAS